MRPIELNRVQHDSDLSTHLPFTHLQTPTVLVSQSGALMSVIQCAGVPFDTAQTATLHHYQHLWHRALMALDARFCVWGTTHRRRVSMEGAGDFTNPLAARINAAYQAQCNTDLYVNDLYLALIYKGTTAQSRLGLTRWLSRLTPAKHTPRHPPHALNSQPLHKAVCQLMTALTPFKPRLLGENDTTLGYSEVLAYVSLFINGGSPVKLPPMTYGSPMGKTFKQATQAYYQYPAGHIAPYLSTQRLFFGQAIQYQGACPNDTRFAALVSVKRYATQTSSLMLNPLLQLPCEWISTHSFAIASPMQADQRMARQARRLHNTGDPALSQIDALSTARDALASDQIMMGYHHNTVMVFSESLKTLDHHVAQVIHCYLKVGWVAVRETLGQEAAFWAQIPTNLPYIARASLISSRNFVDAFPWHNYATGFKDGNHLGGALTLIETPAKTPLWLNLHARGPKDNPAPGHTMVIGGTGSGKTVALCFFDAQLNRYGGRSVFFDRNRGVELYIRASGGYYGVLAPHNTPSLHFNPLQLPDAPKHRQFCQAWLGQLVKKDGEGELDATIATPLSQCVHYAYDQLAPPYRTLSQVTELLPVDFARWPELRRWLKGAGNQPDGEYAYLFDHKDDTLNLHSKMGFDMTHLLDHEPSNVLTAVMMYLFYRLEGTLASGGTLLSIFLDEAWQYLDNPYWRTQLKQWLPTLRKLNAHLILATQSAHSVVTSPISATLLDNCATHIYFANPQAKPEHYIEGLNLTPAELDCIRSNSPQSRRLLYKQGHDSALGQLKLGSLNGLLPLLSSTPDKLQLLADIQAEVGKDPKVWLPHFLNRCTP